MRKSSSLIGLIAGALICFSTTASAQMRGGPGQRRQPARQSDPKPRPQGDDDERGTILRAEPVIAPPQDPLAISPEVGGQIGSDWQNGPPSPEGTLRRRQWFPYYEETRADYRLRTIPPFFIERTRGLLDSTQLRYGVPQTADTEGLYGLLYYRRRSLALDMDVVFPAFWRVRDGESHVVVAGPVVHREAPLAHDNWLAPLFFEGSRADGGYFHAPLLLTTSHSGRRGAFALVGPYFRNRTGSDVDFGVAPLFFHGDNGNLEGSGRRYTLVPPLLFYHVAHDIDSSWTTVAGPLVVQSNPKRDIVDVAPLFFHIQGKPQSGGVVEEHTTLFPFFHYGRDPEQSLFIVPGYYRRVSHTTDTMLSLIYSRALGRGGATNLTVAGPLIPLWWKYTDRDLGVRAWGAAPFFYTSSSPAGHDWLTPLVGRFESYGESTTWWVLPSFTFTTDTHGWENDFHPIVYTGRSDDSTHTVIAPVFWDFANPRTRTTVGFPVYWRFAEGPNDSVVQVAANTLYMQKRTTGGLDWQFHFLPLFSYGESPTGYFWNVLFGLAGYTRDGARAEVRALWLPIGMGGASVAPRTATVR